jgi:hypothetical protein
VQTSAASCASPIVTRAGAWLIGALPIGRRYEALCFGWVMETKRFVRLRLLAVARLP